MKKSYKCPNNHTFKSDADRPKCPQCSETGTRVQWASVPEKNESSKKDGTNIISAAYNLTVGAVVSGLSAGSSKSQDQDPSKDNKNGKGGR